MTIPIARRSVPPAADVLAASGIHPVLARIYASRGITSMAELDYALGHLPSFETLANIDAATDRLARAIAEHERIVVVADYDADGATACSVAVRGLRAMGATVDFVVGNRFEHGYGLTPEVVAVAAAKAPHLLVTVDNGIASLDGVAAASARGIDVLVTDHHLPGPRLPAPAVIVNPNQPGCAFPSKNIAGVGVMFYVLLALRARLRADGRFSARPEPKLAALLDIVALGTVADVVRLDHVNRTFVEHGLARIRAGRAHPGVTALLRVAGRDPRSATAHDLGFVAGPRLNAAGRLADMSIGIRCLLADSDDEARAIAGQLDQLNHQRREVESTVVDEALADLESAPTPTDAFTVCLHRPDWHQGVVGIVASRLKDRLHRPAVVFARGNDGELRGSGRSIQGFHLRDALDLVAKRAPDVVQRFGGHAFAAGVSIREGSLSAFAAAFEAVARDQLTPAHLRRNWESDGPLPAGALTFELAQSLAGAVWGQGFPAPAFDDSFVVADQRVVGDAHLRMTLTRGSERFSAVMFRRVEPLPDAGIRIVYRPEIREWQGLQSVELIVEHWTPADAAS